MVVYKEVLEKLNLNITIWNIVTRKQYYCNFDNNYNNLDDYLENNTEIKVLYENFVVDKKEVSSTINGTLVTFGYINDNVFYETHCNNSLVNQDEENSSQFVNHNMDVKILKHVNNCIRTPLTNIIGFLSLLSDTKLSRSQKNYMTELRRGILDIVSLSNDIVDIVNFENKLVEFNTDILEFEKCVKTSIKIVDESFKSNDICISYKIDSYIPLVFKGDNNRIQQLLVNMMTTSLRNTDIGNINLNISVYDYDNTQDPFKDKLQPLLPNQLRLLIRMTDSGGGLSDDDIIMMTDIFGIDKEGELTGNYDFNCLISRYICNLMNGFIWFKTEKDIGTTYYASIVINQLN